MVVLEYHTAAGNLVTTVDTDSCTDHKVLVIGELKARSRCPEEFRSPKL
jgi:hypothetical protein